MEVKRSEVKAANLAELPPGGMKSVRIKGLDLLLLRKESGEVYALEDRCSHADVALSEGTFDGDEVTCVAHGARFDACTGKALCMPAVKGVQSFPVRVEGEEILVTVPE